MCFYYSVVQKKNKVTLSARRPWCQDKGGPLAASCLQQWYGQRMRGLDWKPCRPHLPRDPQSIWGPAGTQPGNLPRAKKCEERMPTAWEFYLSYLSKEFQACDQRRRNRKCVLALEFVHVCECGFEEFHLFTLTQKSWGVYTYFTNIIMLFHPCSLVARTSAKHTHRKYLSNSLIVCQTCADWSVLTVRVWGSRGSYSHWKNAAFWFG